MVRSALACPHTVVSIILLKVIRFLGNSLNCARVLEDGVSTAIETASISSDKTSLHDMEDPSSKARKSMVRIGAITLRGLIKLDLYQLCLLVMVLLVWISTFSKGQIEKFFGRILWEKKLWAMPRPEPDRHPMCIY